MPKALTEDARTLREAIGSRIVGQTAVVEQVLVAVLAGGHCLLEGVPGLAKTLLVRTLSEALDLSFSRIQFTPDLMPSDITGTEVIMNVEGEGSERGYRFLPGPLFANLVLADEVNRTPPKTQAAVLEGMEEGQVTSAGVCHVLPKPFLVMATQNPIEQEGTYPLPLAAMDRFLFKIRVGYPDAGEERRVVLETLGGPQALKPVIAADRFRACQAAVRELLVPEALLARATRFVRATRPGDPLASAMARKFLSWGASPRGAQALIAAARARAALAGRAEVLEEDLAAVALPALRHRLVLNYHAEAEDVSPDALIQDLLVETGLVPAPRSLRPSLWNRLLGRRAQAPWTRRPAPTP